MRLLLLCLTAFAAALPAFAAPDDFRQTVKELCRHAAEQSRPYWQGEYWGEVKFPDNQTVYSGRNVHYCSLMYWAMLQEKFNGDQASGKLALTHYDYIVKHFWDEKLGRFRTGYDFLSNASMAIAFGLCLRDAGSEFPPRYREDIKKKLRAIAAYLPTYTTAQKNTDFDLRANNQDAFASLALALTSHLLGDDAVIRKSALKKFRSILAVARQSFWIEGGVDIGYQSVGEPAFMAAADLLWDDLSRAEKKQVADLLLCGRVGNGFGMENFRSPSWLRPDGNIFSSAILCRVANPSVACDASELFRTTAAKGFKSKWWLHDPASLSFFSGMIKLGAATDTLPRLADRFAWGSLAWQGMNWDEQQMRYNSAEKAYLTGTGGTTAIFGDYARTNYLQTKAKFGNDRAPRCWNSGGMRYLGRNEHFYIWTDDTLGCPRLFSSDPTSTPQLVSRQMFPGFAASEYLLTQVMPGYGGTQPVFVDQTFTVVDRVMLVLFRTPQSLKGITYDITVPVKGKINLGPELAVIPEPRLGSSATVTLGVRYFGTPAPQIDRNRWKPYFKTKITVNNRPAEPPPLLHRLMFPLGDGQTALLMFIPENNARGKDEVKVLRHTEQDGVMTLDFTIGKRSFTVLAALKPLERITAATPAKAELVLDRPRPGFLQVIGSTGTEINLLTVHAAGLKIGGREYFRAPEPVMISALNVSKGKLVEIAGNAEVADAFGTDARSLIDNAAVKLPARTAGDRLLIETKP